MTNDKLLSDYYDAKLQLLTYTTAQTSKGLPFDEGMLIALVNEVLRAADALYNAYASSAERGVGTGWQPNVWVSYLHREILHEIWMAGGSKANRDLTHHETATLRILVEDGWLTMELQQSGRYPVYVYTLTAKSEALFR